MIMQLLRASLTHSKPSQSINKPTKPERKQQVQSLNILKCFTTRLDDIQRLVIIHPVIMNKRFIRRITQLNKSLLGLSWVGFANLGGQAPQTPLFNQKEQGYNLLKWCPVKWGNRSLSPFISVPIYFPFIFRRGKGWCQVCTPQGALKRMISIFGLG